jgi:hypothetical protein
MSLEGLAETASAMLGIWLGELDGNMLGDVDGSSNDVFEGA